MTSYTAILEVRTGLSASSVSLALSDYAATVYAEPQGYLEVVLRVPAESAGQATQTALAVVKEATGGPVVALEVTPEGSPPPGVPSSAPEQAPDRTPGRAPGPAPVDVRGRVRTRGAACGC